MDIYTDSVPPDKLWELLPPSKRAAFLKSVQDPESALARVLLGEVEKEEGGGIEVPWWVEESGGVHGVEEEDERRAESESESKNERKAHVTKIIPAMMELPPNLLVLSTENTPRQAEKPQGPSLMCNIFAFMCVSLPRKS